MNSLLGSLLLTPESSVILGFSLAICVMTCFLCISFYFKFRHQSLLNLSLAIIAFQFMMVMYDHMPPQFSALQNGPVFTHIAHFSGSLVVYAFYRLFVSAFQPFPTFKFVTARFYKMLVIAALSIRFAGLVYPAVALFRMASLANIIFYITTLILCIRYKSKNKSTLMLRIGCGIGVVGLSVYPLIRTGIISSSYLMAINNYILICTITLFSILSLAGALELGRDYLDRAEKASLRNMARAFIQIRDLVNTPFQTIDLTVQLIRQRHPEETDALQKIENSLDILRRVDAALAKHEGHVDWEQTENFIEVDSPVKK